MLILRLDLPRAAHPNHGIVRTIVAVHHVQNKLLAPTLDHKKAGALAGFPQDVGNIEDLALACVWDVQNVNGLKS